MADKEYTNDLAQRLQRLEDQINGSKHIMNSGDNTMTELPHDYVTLKRKIVANPAPLGLFAFGLTTALLQVNTPAELESLKFLVLIYRSVRLGSSSSNYMATCIFEAATKLIIFLIQIAESFVFSLWLFSRLLFRITFRASQTGCAI